MKKILVIGGSRFIGPLLIDEFLKSDVDVTVFNRGLIRSDYPAGVRFIQGDRNSGFNIPEHFDVVIDMCAYKGAETKRALKELHFDFFIHMSTAAVYQKTEIFPLTEKSPIGPWPLWGDYNKGKVECEEVLANSKTKFAVIRPVYILGPNNYCNREQFIYSKIKKGGLITIPGNGKALVQFVFSEEVAAAIVLIADKRTTGVFNLVGDDIVTLTGLVNIMGDIVGKKPTIEYNLDADAEKFDIKEFPFANENLVCDNSKMKKHGIAFVPLAKGLAKEYREYYAPRT